MGLGNPGKAYAAHRHNAGFWWIDAAIRIYPAELKAESRFQGLFGRTLVNVSTSGLLGLASAKPQPQGLLSDATGKQLPQGLLGYIPKWRRQGLLSDAKGQPSSRGLLGPTSPPHPSKPHGLTDDVIDYKEIFFLLPQTFMNASGRAVGALAGFYKILPPEILVVHDELDLPPGEVRLKLGGGHAGHNGLKDIVASLGAPDFWRMRLGIGHPGVKEEVVNYVLNKPAPTELSLIQEAINESVQALPLLAQGVFPEAQARINMRRKP